LIGIPNVNLTQDEQEKQMERCDPSKPLYLLDICCGAGTIGQCQMRRIERAIQVGKFSGSYACIGVELIEQAVQDARRNAIDNGFSEDKTKYISGDAAFIFRHVNEYFNIDPKDETSTICGILGWLIYSIL
jgi:tRNA/tmRNA/rRNA uracil-C5-methylase (TrmA/RlmC/RlmD family)